VTREQLAAQLDAMIRNYVDLEAELERELRRKSELDEAIKSKQDQLSAAEMRLSDLQSELAYAIEAESYENGDDTQDNDDDDSRL
jgi:hypothetical protein